MKLKKIVKHVVVLLAIVSVIPSMAMARPGKGFKNDSFSGPFRGGSMSGLWKNQQLIQELNLTETQTEKLKDLDFAQREKQLELRNQLETLHLEMRKAVAEEKLDDKNILSIAKRISDTRGKLFVQRVEGMLEASKLLNDDQLKKLKTFQFQKKGRGFRQGRGPNKGGFGDIRN